MGNHPLLARGGNHPKMREGEQGKNSSVCLQGGFLLCFVSFENPEHRLFSIKLDDFLELIY